MTASFCRETIDGKEFYTVTAEHDDLPLASPFAKWLERFPSAVDRLIERQGATVTSAIVAMVLVTLACVYVRPGFPFLPDNLVGITDQTVNVARDPFSFDWATRPQGYRIAIPLLSYALGLKGELVAYTNFTIVLILVFAIFLRYRLSSGSSLLALGVTLSLTFTAPVLYTIYDLGSIDAARVLVTCLMIWWARVGLVFWLLFILNIFIHEGAIPFLPLFLLLRWPHRKNILNFILADVAVSLASIALYLPFYAQTGTAGQPYVFEILASGSVFVDKVLSYVRYWGWHVYDGLFSGLKLLWIVVALGIVAAVRRRNAYDVFLMLSPLVGVAAVMLVGNDITRYAMLAFPSVLFAVDEGCKRFGNDAVGRGLLFLTAINLVVPQQIFWGKGGGPMPSLLHFFAFWVF